MDKTYISELIEGNTYESLEIIGIDNDKMSTIPSVTFKNCSFRSIENVSFYGCRFDGCRFWVVAGVCEQVRVQWMRLQQYCKLLLL